jgi:hypothetical protein
VQILHSIEAAAVGIVESYNSIPSRYVAIGYVRGVAVMATAYVGNVLTSEQAKSDLVGIVDKQVDKFNVA